MLNILSKHKLFFVLLALWVVYPFIAQAQLLYRYIDEDGVLHYTDDLGKIPLGLKEEVRTDARKISKQRKSIRKRRKSTMIIPNVIVFSPLPPPSYPPTVQKTPKSSDQQVLYPPITAKPETSQIKRTSVSNLSMEDESIDIEKDKDEIEALWITMEKALRKGNIEKALSYFDQSSQPIYRTQFTLSQSYLNTYLKEMGKISAVEIKKNRAEYKIHTLRDGVAYSHPLLFVREEDGSWRIKSF